MKLTVRSVGLAIFAALVLAGLVAIIILTMMLKAKDATATTAKVDGTMAGAAVAAGDAAGAITERHYEKLETRLEVHHENAQAIQSAPGASTPLDPDYLRVLCDGLRKYDSGRGACDQVQPPDPAKLADAGSGSGDPKP